MANPPVPVGYVIRKLPGAVAAIHDWMTYPAYRPRCHAPDAEEHLLAVGAFCFEECLGLGLAEVDASRQATLLSVFVHPDHRQRGLGQALLQTLQGEAAGRGWETLSAVFMDDIASAAALRRLFAKLGWTEPTPRLLVVRADCGILEQLRRRLPIRPPQEGELIDWSEVTPADRAVLHEQQAQAPWAPAGLWPFAHEAGHEPLNSLACRRHGALVGWIITHRLDPQTICWTCGFVHPDLQRSGLYIWLLDEAARRQIEAAIPRVLWTVPLKHRSMANFVRRWILPLGPSWTMSYGARKRLADCAG